MDKYLMWTHYERLYNHNKAKHNKTVCIFLGIYCNSDIARLSMHILRWTVTSHWHRQYDFNCGVFAISEHTKQFLELCNINEWRRGHRSHTLARFGRNFVCNVTYLLISPQENPRFELSYRGNLQYPVEFKIVRTEKWLRTEPPVELAQCNWYNMIIFSHSTPPRADLLWKPTNYFKIKPH